jgi:hypothetical protein
MQIGKEEAKLSLFVDDIEEMDKFLYTYDLPKLNQEATKI